MTPTCLSLFTLPSPTGSFCMTLFPLLGSVLEGKGCLAELAWSSGEIQYTCREHVHTAPRACVCQCPQHWGMNRLPVLQGEPAGGGVCVGRCPTQLLYGSRGQWGDQALGGWCQPQAIPCLQDQGSELPAREPQKLCSHGEGGGPHNRGLRCEQLQRGLIQAIAPGCLRPQ